MMTLSNEMLCMIFEKVDNVLLLFRLREVNERFLDVIEFLVVKLDLWKKLCHEDDKKPWIREIIKQKFPQILENEFDLSDPSNWKEIFLSYQKWRRLANYGSLWNTLNYDPEVSNRNEIITCMDVWAQDLVVGTNTGKTYFYKIDNGLRSTHCMLYKNNYIVKIKLWFVGKITLIAVVFLTNHYVIFWDVTNKKTIMRTSFSRATTATACNDYRFYIATNSDIYEYEWRENELHKGRYTKLTIHFSNDEEEEEDFPIIEAMYADQNKLTAIFRNAYSISTISFIISSPEHQNFQLWSEDFSIHTLESVPLQNVIFYIPINNVVLAIDDSNLYVSVKSEKNHKYRWNIYQMYESWNENISAVLMYSNILLFGLKSGQLFLYFLENLEQLLDLTRKPVFLKELILDTNPITNLNIVELGDTLYIFATTASKLHLRRYIMY